MKLAEKADTILMAIAFDEEPVGPPEEPSAFPRDAVEAGLIPHYGPCPVECGPEDFDDDE